MEKYTIKIPFSTYRSWDFVETWVNSEHNTLIEYINQDPYISCYISNCSLMNGDHRSFTFHSINHFTLFMLIYPINHIDSCEY